MKKTKVLAIFVILFLAFSVRSYAAESKINLVGKKEINAGEKQTIYIRLTSDNAVGVIEGVLKYDSNIELVTFSAKDEKWNLTYNENNGKFNCYYAEGAKSGDILQIEYKLKSGAEKGTIEVNDVVFTTIDYKTVEAGSVSGTVFAKQSKVDESTSDDEKKDDKSTSDTDKANNTDKTKNEAKNNNEVIPSNSAKNSTSVDGNKKANDGSGTNSKIPQLGENWIIVFVIAGGIVIGGVLFARYRKYKGI